MENTRRLLMKIRARGSRHYRGTYTFQLLCERLSLSLSRNLRRTLTCSPKISSSRALPGKMYRKEKENKVTQYICITTELAGVALPRPVQRLRTSYIWDVAIFTTTL